MNLKDKISRRLFKIETEDTLTLDENIFYEKQIVGKVVSETPAFGIFKMEKFKNYADNILITSNDKKLKLIRQKLVEHLVSIPSQILKCVENFVNSF